MRLRWPSEEELQKLREEEEDRALLYDEEADPICECGNAGYMCYCDALAETLGHYPDGTPYEQ